MTQNTMTKPEMTKNECMSAVEYFQAKLECEMTPGTLKGLMDRDMMSAITLLDVRSSEEFKKCRIPGAACMPMTELAGKMNALPKNKNVVVYCGGMSCDLATKACLELSKNGFKAMELCGGIDMWMEKGCPVEKKA